MAEALLKSKNVTASIQNDTVQTTVQTIADSANNNNNGVSAPPPAEDTSSPSSFVYQEPAPAVQDKVQPYTFLEEIPRTYDANRRNVDALNSAARASALGQDPVVAYQSVKQDSKYRADALSEMFLSNTGETLQQIEGKLAVNAERGVPVQDTLKEHGVNPISAYSSEAMAAAHSYVASIPTFTSLSPKEQEDVAFLKYLDFMTAKVADDIGWNWHTVSDFGGYLVPQENIRYSQVADVLGLDYKAMDAVDYTDFVNRATTYIRTEAPEKRQQMIETIVSAWPEISGNNRLALVDFLQRIGDPNDPVGTHIESGLERADQASYGVLFGGKVISGFVKSIGLIKTATKMKNVEAVADAVTMGSQGMLKDAGIEPIEAMASLDPSEHVNTLVKGADNTYAAEVGKIQKEVDIYLDAASRVNAHGIGLTDAEKAAARDRAVLNLNKQEEITNLVATPVDEKTFKLTFNRIDSAGGPPIKVNSTMYYTLDDIAEGEAFVSKEGAGYTYAPKLLTSPNFRFLSDRNKLVQTPEQLNFLSSKTQSLYDGAITAALKPLSASEMGGVDEFLSLGDEWVDELGSNSGKIFSYQEAVVEGVNGARLSEKQYASYLGVRKVVDHLHYAKNKDLIEQYASRGTKFADWEGDTIPVRHYETAADATKGFHMASHKSPWVATEDGIKTFNSADNLTQDMIEQMYQTGHKLVRASEGKLLSKDGANVEWAFIKATKLRQPSGLILNYRTGYMPKIRKDAFYFVKEIGDLKVGATTFKDAQLKTVRYFDNHTDAMAYTEELNKLDPGRYKILADRELTPAQIDSEFTNISGGLFTGKRGEPIPFGTGGAKGERVDALGSLQRYVRNIAKNAPMNLYREGMQQRWLQHAKDAGALSKRYEGSFADAVHPSHLDINNTTSPFLQDSHAQITFFSGIRTEAEKELLAKQREIAKRLEKVPFFGKVMSRKLLNSSKSGVEGTIKGLTFHLMLGMYNPAQFAIQASGALLAISIHPIHGLKAVGQMAGYAIVDTLIANPAKKAKFIEHMRKSGFDMDGYDLWDKSGLREAVVNTNLDYHSIWSDKPYDAGLLRKVISNDTLFQKQGELVAARVSFATAYNQWRSLNPTAKVDMFATKAILARTEQLRLNMTKPNSAGFQQGLLSIPTQFQQVNTKFFEKLLGKDEFTPWQKRRLIAGQFALFGAAGVPLVKSIMPHMMETLNSMLPEEKQINAENTSPEVLNTLYNGCLAWFIQDYMDIHSVVTGRMALGQDFVENTFNIWNGTIGDLALGPFKSVYDSASNGWERTMAAVTTVQYADDASLQDWVGVSEVLARSVADLPASTRNLYKAYDMTHSEFFRNKAGRPVAEWTTLNNQTMIAQALGFSAQEVADWYELNARAGGAIPKTMAEGEADRIVRLLADMSDQDEPTRMRWNAMAVNAILNKYSRPEDRIVVMKAVQKKVEEPTDAWGKAMKRVLIDWQSELNAGLGEIHQQMKERSSPAVARKLSAAGMNKATNEQAAQEGAQ